jgi:MarR family 2-MHQ and catechol resistance regulon transcriptional repressor
LQTQLYSDILRHVASPLDDDRLTPVGLFLEAHAGLSAVLERRLAADCGLPPPWFEILLRLSRSPGERLRMADLAAQVALSPSGLTRAVDRMEEAGLVARANCPSDRRGAYAVLTDEGRAKLEEGLPGQVAESQRHFVDLLTPAELTRLTATLRKLRDHLNPGAARVPTAEG